MAPEEALVDFIHGVQLSDLPREAREIVATMVSTNIGTTVAGSAEDGCTQLRRYLVDRGGRPEATVLVHGDRLPAAAAAQLNATMARALDYEDALVPGLHLGAALIPTALACAELRGGVDGTEFVSAVAVGAEIGARLNLPDHIYDGFDPTGVVGPLAATATAARLLMLPADRTRHALGLAFNRSGGSFQSNVDGSLAVRLIQGWAAESGVLCAQLAHRGMTGPTNFLDGVYGYAHLYGRDGIDAPALIESLAERWALEDTGFKKYPSCGLTQGATELALRAHASGLDIDSVSSIEITMTPYGRRLVGDPFDPGENPRVAAQFNARYCTASTLLRGASTLEHFTPDAITDPAVLSLAERVVVIEDSSLDERGHGATRLRIHTADGDVLTHDIDAPPGFPGNRLTPADHEARLRDCLTIGPAALPDTRADDLVTALCHLDELEDVTALIDHLSVQQPASSPTPA